MLDDNCYDREGEPITYARWSRLFSDKSYCKVAVDDIGEGIMVSTVWLGLNHNFGDGVPLIFETMVFGGKLNTQMWRYSTEDEARTGHQTACELVRLELALA